MAQKRANSSDESAAKRRQTELPPQSEEALQAIIEVHQKLKAIDDECVKEQMEIQKKYDTKKQPLFEDRQKHVEGIPQFWAQALIQHPNLYWISEDDKAVLKHLKKVEVEDNLDVNGSYRIKMLFSEEAKEYFEPLELVKHVVFKPETQESGPKDLRLVEEVTEIQFKADKDLCAKARKAREAGKGTISFFEWFSKTDEEMFDEDIGELLRREVWHYPHMLYLDQWEEKGDESDTDSDDLDAEDGDAAVDAEDGDDE